MDRMQPSSTATGQSRHPVPRQWAGFPLSCNPCRGGREQHNQEPIHSLMPGPSASHRDRTWSISCCGWTAQLCRQASPTSPSPQSARRQTSQSCSWWTPVSSCLLVADPTSTESTLSLSSLRFISSMVPFLLPLHASHRIFCKCLGNCPSAKLLPSLSNKHSFLEHSASKKSPTVGLSKSYAEKRLTWCFSLQMSQSTSSSGNSSLLRKTGYNRHFPRSFLLNYRPALQNPSNDVVLSHLHS